MAKKSKLVGTKISLDDVIRRTTVYLQTNRWSLEFVDLGGECSGKCNFNERSIEIEDNMTAEEKESTICHELAHMQLHGEHVRKNCKQLELENILIAELDERLNLTEEEKKYSHTYHSLVLAQVIQAQAQVGSAGKIYKQIELEAQLVTYIVQNILLESIILTREQTLLRAALIADKLRYTIKNYVFTWNRLCKNKIFVSEVTDSATLILEEIFEIKLDSNKKLLKCYEMLKSDIKTLIEVI